MSQTKPSGDDPAERRTDGKRPIWLRPWFQTLLGVLIVFLFLSFVLPPIFGLIYAARSVLGPVLVGAVLAYIFNPVVTWMRRNWHMPRWAGTSLVVLALVLAVGGMAAVATPVIINQSGQLIKNLKEKYPNAVSQFAEQADNATGQPNKENQDNGMAPAQDDSESNDSGQSQTADQATEAPDIPGMAAGQSKAEQAQKQNQGGYFSAVLDSDSIKEFLARTSEYLSTLDWSAIGGYATEVLDIGVGLVGSVISFTTYLLVFFIVVGFSFFFMSWHLGEVKAWFVPFIPVAYRERTLELLHKMDFTVSRWLRGRLLQALLLAIMLGVGWWIFEVPYWFLLAVLGGVLGLVPYLIVFAFAIALVLATLDDVAAQQFTIWTLVWPTVVYAIAQSIDGWVVEPLLQGKATEMNAFTVLVVVLIGGALFGLVGLLAAIPISACIKILLAEVVLPKLRQYAAGMDHAPG